MGAMPKTGRGEAASCAGAELVVLTLQPRPVLTRTAHLRHRGGAISAIYREWQGSDPARCRLCPVGTCCAQDGACLILVEGDVSDDEAELFSTARIDGFRWQDGGIGPATRDDAAP
jgi:hypothetical protein